MIDGCDALLRIEGLPQGLHHLDILNCLKLNQVPSVVGMNSLMSLSFGFCRSLTRIEGFECLTALEEIDLFGCTSLVDCGLLGMHNRGLRKCMLSGSNAAVAYDNRWLEREPSSQLLSYNDSVIGYLPNGMAKKVSIEEGILEEVIMEVTISSEAECVALIFCFLANCRKRHPVYQYEYIDMVVKIMRDGMLVAQTRESVILCIDECDQVILWTLRRGYLIVQSLLFGDHISLTITTPRFIPTKPTRQSLPISTQISVVEGAICVVHAEDEGAEDEHLILGVNSELLSRRQSKDLATKFEQLVLVDHCSHISRSHLNVILKYSEKIFFELMRT